MVGLSRDLKSDCARRLDGISIPKPFDLGIFCRELSAQRGRPIEILPLAQPPSDDHPFGMWLAARDADLLFLDMDTSAWHRDHIAAHEISHMLWGDTDAIDDLILAQLFPGLSPESVRTILGWKAPDKPKLPGVLARMAARRQSQWTERRAELTGTLLLARAEHPMVARAYAATAAARIPAAWSADG